MMSAGVVSVKCYMILLLLRQLRACTRDVPGSWVKYVVDSDFNTLGMATND